MLTFVIALLFCILSFSASFCCMAARCLTSSLACLSAVNKASANWANLSLIVTSCRPRPSAARRLSRGTV